MRSGEKVGRRDYLRYVATLAGGLAVGVAAGRLAKPAAPEVVTETVRETVTEEVPKEVTKEVPVEVTETVERTVTATVTKTVTAPPEQPEKPEELPPREEFPLPPVDSSAPLPSPPSGEYRTLKLGDVEITYFTPIVIRGPGILECGTDIVIRLKNRGDRDETIAFTPASPDLIGQVPQQVYHFFSFQPEVRGQPPSITIGPGQERELRYFLSEEFVGEFTLVIDFWFEDAPAERVTAEIRVVFEDYPLKKLPLTSIVYGVVTDSEGNAVSDVEVELNLYNGRQPFRGLTDDQGRYAIAIPALEDLQSVFGERELPFASLGYFITVERDGYRFYYQDGLRPSRAAYQRVDITLEEAVAKPDYSLRWERQVEEPYGFWRALPTADWEHIVAAQAKHPPMLGMPTHFYLLDGEGNVKWSYPTGDECWGADITRDGSLIAVGCHDGNIYAVDGNGATIWTNKSHSMVRWVKFSPDGRHLIGGPTKDADFALFEAGTGNAVWGDSSTKEWLRHAAFSPDNSLLVVGMSSGHLMAFDHQGNKLWHTGIGEFPMFLGMDGNGDVYAAGKSRTLFAFDKDGDPRWRYRIPDHVVTAGDVSVDGKIALGTVGGWIYLFSGDGRLLWRRRAGRAAIGHNAIAINPSGEYIVAGTGPDNEVLLLDSHGTLLWKYKAEPEPLTEDMLMGVVHVAISNDASKILAAYGDSYLREFGRR